MHHLQAVLGKGPVVSDLASRWHRARVIDLPQSFALIPLSRALREDIDELVGDDRQRRFPSFRSLSDAVAEIVEDASLGGPLALIETEFFGGAGEQRSVVWDAGRVVLGPLDHARSVNAALERVGVQAPDWCDEFDALHLVKYRSTEDTARFAS